MAAYRRVLARNGLEVPEGYIQTRARATMPETRYGDHLNVAFDMNNLGHLLLQTGERAAASEGGGPFKKEQDSLWETGHLGRRAPPL
jgi:hypothetical protein